MATDTEFLEQVYQRFNARDIEFVLAALPVSYTHLTLPTIYSV